MATLVFLIEQVSIGLYIFIGVAILWQWRSWRQARWAYRATQFELERDIARYRRANAMTSFVLLIEAGLMVYGVQSVVAPTVREIDGIAAQSQSIVTDVRFNTPTPAPPSTFVFDRSGVVFENENPADRIFSTATPQPTPVGTIVSNAPERVGCDSPDATLQIPANGMKVFQITEVVGTGNTASFAKYKLEINGPSTFGSFASLESGISPVINTGSLGQFNPSAYEPGLYQFRVAVFDSTDTMRASCTVNIYIEEPQPTYTPLPLPSPGA